MKNNILIEINNNMIINTDFCCYRWRFVDVDLSRWPFQQFRIALPDIQAHLNVHHHGMEVKYLL